MSLAILDFRERIVNEIQLSQALCLSLVDSERWWDYGDIHVRFHVGLE